MATTETTPAAEPETPQQTEPEAPSPDQVTEAIDRLSSLPEAERKAVASRLAPPAPGEDGRVMNREQARELLESDPEGFHRMMDAQAAGGPRVFDFGTTKEEN